MTSIRRTLTILTASLALALGVTTPAQAAFSAAVTVPPVVVGTVTVQPPTALSTAGSVCSNSTLNLHLTWGKSTTARVASYRVRMYTNVGFNWALGTASSGQTSYDTSMSIRVNGNPTTYQFTLSTTTDYGWTAESTRTGAITC